MPPRVMRRRREQRRGQRARRGGDLAVHVPDTRRDRKREGGVVRHPDRPASDGEPRRGVSAAGEAGERRGRPQAPAAACAPQAERERATGGVST